MQLAADPTAAPPPGAARPVVSDIAGRLERLPMSGYQRRIFAIIASAWLVDQIDVALLTFLLGSIVVAFGLTPTEAGQLAAMTFAGQLVGNILAGTASDRFGRKTVFQMTMVVWGLASLAAASSWSLASLMVCRFLIGAGVGGEAPVAQAMVSEIVPAQVRGKYIAILEGFWAVGYVLSGAISFFVLPYLGWRWAFVVVGLLSLVVLAVRRSMPESPRWLAEAGRHEEAEAVMDRMERAVERATGRPLPRSPPGSSRRWRRPTPRRG
ncbi:MFS transporter [Methylobacterium sp. P31]